MNADTVSRFVLYGLVVFTAIIALGIADAPVAKHRVEVFAARQDLSVTEDNCAQVIAYLAVTRRWRSAGLVGAVTWYLVVGLRHQTIGVNIAYALSGWFVGAVIAEIHVNGLVTGRRAASLERRTLDRYLPSVHRRLLPLAGAACLMLAGIAGATGYVDSARTIAVWVAAGIGLPTIVALVTRWILLRPQQYASPDVLSADEAIRRRSLRVITGSAITLLLYCVVDQVLALLNRSGPGIATAVVVIVVGAVAVPVTGWRLAGGKVPA
jgi:hypothetical protein